jgi:hypothetical protein
VNAPGRTIVCIRVELTDDERDFILCGLFELTITYLEDDELRDTAKVLALKLGADPDAMFFGGDPGDAFSLLVAAGPQVLRGEFRVQVGRTRLRGSACTSGTRGSVGPRR